MDLFNKKKVAWLENELLLTREQLKATSKELGDLQEAVSSSYQELTEYFNPRYKNKYFKVELTPEQDEVSCAETVYMQVLNVVYKAGIVSFTINEGLNNVEMSILDLPPTELKRLKVITKKEFLEKEDK